MSTARITMQDNNSNDLFQKNAYSEQVIDILMDWIMEGKFVMGDRLNANQIAQSLGISRMPVREALLDLEKRGLAESTPYAGMRLVVLSEDDIKQIYLARKALEPIAAQYACRYVTDEDIKRLEEIHKEYERIVWDENAKPIDSYTQNRLFHFEIYKISRLNQICAMIEQLWDRLSFFKLIYGHDLLETAESKAELVQTHREYLDALIARDEEKIFDLVAGHTNKRIEYIPYSMDEYLGEEKKG